MLCKTEPYVPRIALARVIQHINIIEGHNFTINSITAIQLFSQTMTVEQIDFQYYLHTRYIGHWIDTMVDARIYIGSMFANDFLDSDFLA